MHSNIYIVSACNAAEVLFSPPTCSITTAEADPAMFEATQV